MQASSRRRASPRLRAGLVAATVTLMAGVFADASVAAPLSITEASWDSGERRLRVRGAGTNGAQVAVKNAASGVQLSSPRSVSEERWRLEVSNPSPVPCRVRAESNGSAVERDVSNRPSNCGPTASTPPAGNAAQAHATMTTYDGPQTCVRCHEGQARQMHGSVHYQQNAVAPNVTNINPPGTPTASPVKAGEGPAGIGAPAVDALISVNTYCGTHENSPRFTCANCHVGNGRWPKTPAEFTLLGAGSQAQKDELANIDCLTCHQQVYKRFPDWTSTSLGFQDLILKNVAEVNGLLVAAPGQQVVRSGLEGIPVTSSVGDFLMRPAGAPGSLQFALPADAPIAAMPLTTEQAAQQAHRTTRQSCLNCHAGAGGGNGTKRGDLSTALYNPPVALDLHMSPNAGGANLTCSSCHNVNGPDGKTLHRVKGRGLDLRANDHPARFTCDSAGCHSSTPHGNVSNGSQLNRHTTKVACQTCHIPTYAKVVNGAGFSTETARNWDKPHVSQTACNGRGGWLPEELKGSNLRPSYKWFDGTSRVYYLTESLAGVPTKPVGTEGAALLGLADPNTPAYILGNPNGTVGNPAAKIYPMKEHWGKLARNTQTNTLVAQSTFEFFRTGSFCRAVAKGLNPKAREGEIDTQCPAQDSPLPSPAEAVAVHTYQTINHGVEPQANALGANNQCNHCHTGNGNAANPRRMQLSGTGGLGYDLREPATSTGLCNNCHGSESNPGFVSLHNEHRNRTVNGRPVTCNSCHVNR